MHETGIDHFVSDPDRPMRDDIFCLACKAKLTGNNETGYHSWTGAMSKTKSTHWIYRCPHVEDEDHEDLVALYKEIDRLVSERLRAVVQGELEEKQLEFMRKKLKEKKG